MQMPADEVKLSDVKAYLMVTGFPQNLWAFPVTDRHAVIGRDTNCDLCLVHPTVSRKHCEVWAEGSSVYVRDLGSRNGTYVNGFRIRKRRLSRGDLLQVGPVVMQLVGALHPGQKLLEQQVQGHETVVPGVGAVAEPGRTACLMQLNPIEQRIVHLLVRGLTEKQVASQLKLSPHTVHSYVKQIYSRLGISSRAELAAWYWSGTLP